MASAPKRGGLRGVGAGIAAIGVVGAAFLLGQQSGREPTAQENGTPNGAPPAPPPATATVGTDPEGAAVQWLRAARTVTYTDPAAATWTSRVQPVITGELAQQTSDLHDASGGAEWADFVAQRCQRSVREVAAIVPAEAPRAPTSAFVQVTGNVITTCAGDTPEQVEPVEATVAVQRGDDGGWRVAKRLY